MEQNPHNPLDQFYRMFDMATRCELLTLREYLAIERVAAWTANDAMQAAIVEALLDRTESLLERIEERAVSPAVRAAEFSGVN